MLCWSGGHMKGFEYLPSKGGRVLWRLSRVISCCLKASTASQLYTIIKHLHLQAPCGEGAPLCIFSYLLTASSLDLTRGCYHVKPLTQTGQPFLLQPSWPKSVQYPINSYTPQPPKSYAFPNFFSGSAGRGEGNPPRSDERAVVLVIRLTSIVVSIIRDTTKRYL